MDEYLVPNASFQRLMDEYKKHGSLVIAYDFDSTVYDFHSKGVGYPLVIELLQDLKARGFYLICFTANDNIELVESYLLESKIPFDSINENPPFFKVQGRVTKIYYNALLDDRAGLIQAYSELKSLLQII